MEASVKYISDHFGTKPAICFRGTKHAHCVMNFDTGISVVKVDLREYDRARLVPNGKGYYEVKDAAKKFLALTKRDVARRSITEKAKELLSRALNGEVTEAALPEENGLDQPITKKEKTKSKKETTTEQPKGERSTTLSTLCEELKLAPAKARRLLRAAGLHAPYNDVKALRAALVR